MRVWVDTEVGVVVGARFCFGRVVGWAASVCLVFGRCRDGHARFEVGRW